MFDNPAVVVLVTAVLAAVLTFVLVKVLDKLRLTDAENKAKEIVSRAEREIENRRKEAELAIKEEALRQKSEGEKELQRTRQELHERSKRHELLLVNVPNLVAFVESRVAAEHGGIFDE